MAVEDIPSAFPFQSNDVEVLGSGMPLGLEDL
jgi:hypothetical protein